MTRRTTLCALMMMLFLLVPSPAVAKGPTQVEVRDLATGTSTMLTWEQPELLALMELVEWPSDRRRPHLVANGGLHHVATLAWQFEDGHPVWVDRVFSNGNGRSWIARRDHLSGNTFVTWGRVRSPVALDLLLARLGEAQPAPANQVVPEPQDTRQTSSASSVPAFGLGAAAAAVVIGGLSLVLRRRRSGHA